MPFWRGRLLTLLTGAAAGALNGVFVAGVRVHPLIVTLATLAAYRGIAEGISLGRPVSGFPAGFTRLGAGDAARAADPGPDLPASPLAVTALCSRGRRSAVWLSAIGYNETAARYSGIAVARIKLLLYTASGLTAGLAALLFVARRNTAKADVGHGDGAGRHHRRGAGRHQHLRRARAPVRDGPGRAADP